MNFIELAGQKWCTENLSVTTFRNGDIILNAQDNKSWVKAWEDTKPAWCYVENKVNGSIEKFYNWYAVHDKRGLAPDGFKIASNYDWDELRNYYRQIDKIQRKKSGNYSSFPFSELRSEVGWMEDYPYHDWKNQKFNGFNAFPNGFRLFNGDFREQNCGAYFWAKAPFKVKEKRFLDLIINRLIRYNQYILFLKFTHSNNLNNPSIEMRLLQGRSTVNFDRDHTFNFEEFTLPNKGNGLSVRCIKL